SKGHIDLNPAVFEQPINRTVLHEVITAYRASLHTGTASTKTRSQVQGGGKKPWRQKGTGRARAGSIRSPLWRKGGVIFGPHPRNYTQRLPGKKIKKGLFMALSHKFKSGDIRVVDLSAIFGNDEKPKTKKIIQMLQSLDAINKKTVIVDDGFDNHFFRAARNIKRLNLLHVKQLAAYSVLVNQRVVMSTRAVEYLHKYGAA
ncbi:MAG: 50S ribosomal protein L4, partial [Elusimicrobia bacterium]|nr:50S ribosomal protein L4 [Elusimicrobiota bacterium]